MLENWSLIEEFPNYSVSDLGRVRNDFRRRLVKISYTRDGQAKVGLFSDERIQYTRAVGRLVAEAFIGGRQPRFDTVTHLDGDLRNNCADNLVWRPRWFAIKYHNQFEPENVKKYLGYYPVYDENTGEAYESVIEAAIFNGLLFFDVTKSATEKSPVWPTWHQFAWVEPENDEN